MSNAPNKKLRAILDGFFILRAGTPDDGLEEIKRRNELGQPEEELLALLEREVREAAKDELEKFKHWYYFDRLEGKELPIENYYDSRLEALEGYTNEKN